MICNIAVNQQGTSGINNISNNLTPATPEDDTSGKTNISKKLKIMNSDEKYASVNMQT